MINVENLPTQSDIEKEQKMEFPKLMNKIQHVSRDGLTEHIFLTRGVYFIVKK